MNCKPAVVYNKVQDWILNNKKNLIWLLIISIEPIGDVGFQA